MQLEPFLSFFLSILTHVDIIMKSHHVLFLCSLFVLSWGIISALGHESDYNEANLRYLIYTVNSGEGFNLRRDVHMRAATLVNELRKKENWILVLPPWPHLYHWKSRFFQSDIKWERFFDVASLNEYVPSIEFEEYLAREGRVIDEVIHLQNFAEGWGDDGFKEKLEDKPCIDRLQYQQSPQGTWTGNVFGHTMSYDDVIMRSFKCVSVQGFTHTLLPELQQSENRSVLVEKFETVMHAQFGGRDFWAARISMVYAKHLREAGNHFMKTQLNYDPGNGNGRQAPRNGGGDFMSVHLRRRDYTYAHADEIPSLEGAAKQINILKDELGLEYVYLSTDAPFTEKETLASLVDNLIWYTPSNEDLNKYGDGGVAIIDQWIAAHAKYFTGTAASTFSFRIREDRQLMGFSRESTFNQMCGGQTDTDPHSCGTPSYWKMPETVRTLLNSRTKYANDEL